MGSSSSIQSKQHKHSAKTLPIHQRSNCYSCRDLPSYRKSRTIYLLFVLNSLPNTPLPKEIVMIIVREIWKNVKERQPFSNSLILNNFKLSCGLYHTLLLA